MPRIAANAALILIDLQTGFRASDYWGARNNPAAEANAARLLATWREAGRPVVHIHHHSTNPASPLHPDTPGVAPLPETAPLPGETVMTKSVNSAFIGTPLEAWLRERGIAQVVICGLTTNHCVETTTRMAGNLGFEALLVADACATHDRTGPDGRHWPAADLHAASLASLHGEFAKVVTTGDILAAPPA